MPFTPSALDLLTADLQNDLLASLPELIVAAAVPLLLVLRMLAPRQRRGGLPLAMLLIALGVAVGQWRSPPFPDAYSGLLRFDAFTLGVRLVVLSGAVLTLVLSLFTNTVDAEDSVDFDALLLGATLGMMLMPAANHLLMVYLAIEMASVPSYALAGFRKWRRASGEAALKYVVYGGCASGVMLYGISLLCGHSGTGYLPDFVTPATNEPVLLLGWLFVLVGLGFKLAAVPFHFWCPDVFDGAAPEVAGYLSVVSKAAAVGLTLRLLSLLPIGELAVPLLAALAIVTMTLGNLAAFRQTNLQRLFAYSTIAHAGTMLVGIAALSRDGAAAALFYLVAYLPANLGAFAAVAFVSARTGSADVSQLRGLLSRAPLLAVCLGVCLLSLLGLPPLGGFAAKFQVFAAALREGAARPAGSAALALYIAAGAGLLNTIFGAVYYLRLLKLVAFDRPDDDAPPTVPEGGILLLFLAALAIAAGLAWEPLARFATQAAAPLGMSP